MSEGGTIMAFTKANFSERQLFSRNCHKKKKKSCRQNKNTEIGLISYRWRSESEVGIHSNWQKKNNSPDGMFHESIKFHYHNHLSPWKMFRERRLPHTLNKSNKIIKRWFTFKQTSQISLVTFCSSWCHCNVQCFLNSNQTKSKEKLYCHEEMLSNYL